MRQPVTIGELVDLPPSPWRRRGARCTLTAFFGLRALRICTGSDRLVTREETTALERDQSFGDMVHIALKAGLAV